MLKSIQLDIITIIVQFICISIYKSRRESVLKLEMSSKFLICPRVNKRCGGSGLVHETNRASPCPSCFEKGISVSECRLDLHHCGPRVSWCTTTITEAKENNTATSLPACCYQLASVSLTSVCVN